MVNYVIKQGLLRACLTGTNSENGRLGSLEMYLTGSEILKTVRLEWLEGHLNLLLERAESLADFWEILVFSSWQILIP